MIFFIFDSSAILKRYKREKGSDTVNKIINYSKGRAFLPNFCIPEVLSVFEVLYHFGSKIGYGRRKKITYAERNKFRAAFLGDINHGRFYPYELDRNHIRNVDYVYEKSFRIAPGGQNDRKRYDAIDTTDCLILSMAIELSALYRTNLFLITSDTHMKKIARALKIKIIDPENPPNLPFLK